MAAISVSLSFRPTLASTATRFDVPSGVQRASFATGVAVFRGALRATVFDLPHVAAIAAGKIAEAGLTDRITIYAREPAAHAQWAGGRVASCSRIAGMGTPEGIHSAIARICAWMVTHDAPLLAQNLARTGARVVVVGCGFIGCEVAATALLGRIERLAHVLGLPEGILGDATPDVYNGSQKCLAAHDIGVPAGVCRHRQQYPE